MKASDPLQRLFPACACLLTTLLVISCGTSSIPPQANTSMPMNRGHWVKVSSNPPTFYPRGVSANVPTDHWSGEWVNTGDDKGTRYFIPLHGLGAPLRRVLVSDALGERSSRKLAEVAAEGDVILARNIKNMTLFGPPTYAALLVSAMGGGSVSEIDIHRLQKEWKTSKEPHQ